MSSPQMTRMLGFFSAAWVTAGGHNATQPIRTAAILAIVLFMGSLVEREHALPVLLHAGGDPALSGRLVVERLGEGAHPRVRQLPRRAICVLGACLLKTSATE